LRFRTSDPDIETIVRRIDRKVIDLQPDFQRGEVWSTAKKQRLIDTILRQWHVPPIHLVTKPTGNFDVLDGQQRLTSIRDFVHGAFAVNGNIEPIDPFIQGLDGIRYGRLPEAVRLQFDAFPVRVFELYDYGPDEPHELFFRLNQPISLTEAEKRNAFIGEPRNQVKELVEWAETEGMTAERVGFSNARMNYDDLIARFLLTLEQRTFLEKVTAFRITTRYRERYPFPNDVINIARDALQFFLGLDLSAGSDTRRKPNKATIHTWLCMTAKLIREGLYDLYAPGLAATISAIESGRFDRSLSTDPRMVAALNIFHDRSTARVADVASVVLRDLCGWLVFTERIDVDFRSPQFLRVARTGWDTLKTSDGSERRLLAYATLNRWGGSQWL
jgi:hypothetical protein